MKSKQSTKYVATAAALALAVIAIAVVATPYLTHTSSSTTTTGSNASSATGSSGAGGQQAGNFLVLLTDPPTVPAGTTQLNVTYSSISIQVKYANGTTAAIPVKATGTVDLLSLVNVSQTIGFANIPTGTTVISIEFTISSASAVVNAQTYSVSLLSGQLVVPIRNGQVLNQTQSAALLDLTPTLVEVDATNSTGGAMSYYVLVPSATAIVKPNVSQGQGSIGAKTQLDQSDKNELESAQSTGMANVTISSATLHTAGNTTTFTVSLKNMGTSNATIFGLTLHGNFSSSATTANTCTQSASSTSSTSSTSTTSKSSTSSTSTSTTTSASSSSSHGNQGNPPGLSNTTTTHGQGQGQGQAQSQGQGQGRPECNPAQDHPDTVPFKVNGTSLVPLFGDGSARAGSGAAGSLTLKPGQSITLSFTGVIGVNTDSGQHGHTLVLGAVAGSTYTIRLDGEGFQTAQVKAT
jgi:hypothetical protein